MTFYHVGELLSIFFFSFIKITNTYCFFKHLKIQTFISRTTLNDAISQHAASMANKGCLLVKTRSDICGSRDNNLVKI